MSDLESDVAHPDPMPDMVHRVDPLGVAIHLHTRRPVSTTLTLPDPLPFDLLLQGRVNTIRHVPAGVQP